MDFAYIKFILLLIPACLGQETEAPTSLNFEVSLKPNQSPLQVKVGKGFIISCSVTSTSDGRTPTLRWDFNGKEITASGVNDRTRVAKVAEFYVLNFKNPQDEDQGTYTCVGTLDGQEDSRSVEIQITESVSVSSKHDQFGILGQNGKVMCEASANPSPTIVWKFENGTTISNDNKYIIRKDHLEIKNLALKDKMKYLCEIFVFESGEQVNFWITYVIVKLPTISMPPTISPNNPKVGDNVQIQCKAEGIPPPTYSFKKGNTFMPDSQVNSGSGLLTIPDLKKSDEATYTCIATNKGGNATESNDLDVMIPPTIEDIPNIDDAAEDSVLNVLCKAQGDPMPEVSWKKKGMLTEYQDGENADGPAISVEIVGLPTGETKKKDVKMTYKPLKSKNAGTYICTAKNIVGEVSKEMTLGVLYKPNFDTDYKIREFYGWKGHTTNMTCQASGNQLAQIFWKQRSAEDSTKLEDIKSVPPFTIMDLVTFPDQHLSSKSLLVQISGDDPSVYGDYFCVAHNVIGNATETIILKQAFPPEKPVVSVKHTYSTMVEISIKKPTANGGQPVNKYQYAFNEDGQTLSTDFKEIDATGEYTYVDLKGMSPTTTYIVSVMAGNDVGFGDKEIINVETLTVSMPTQISITSPPVGPDPTSYRLSWQKPDNGGSPITEFLIQYRKVEIKNEADSPDKWELADDLEIDFTKMTVRDGSADHATLSGLTKDSYYEIRVSAVNKVGESPHQGMIIKTSKGADNTSGRATSLSAGLGTVFLVLLTACFSAL